MDKILSARVNESIIKRIMVLSRELRTTKKSIIEAEKGINALEQTLGAWQRKRSPEENTEQIRHAFRKSMERHHQ